MDNQAYIHDRWKNKNKLIDGVLHRRCSKCLKMKPISNFKRMKTRSIARSHSTVIAMPNKKYSQRCMECE